MQIANKIRVNTEKMDHLVALLVALAITIHILESAIPSPVPGVKPGLANIVTIIVFFHFGIKTAAWVSLLRVLVVGLMLGTLFSPTFILSLIGACATLMLLIILKTVSDSIPQWRLGPVGYSILGAMAHTCAQFVIAYTFFIPHEAILGLLPLLMTTSVLFGLISGLIAASVINNKELKLLFLRRAI